MLTILKPTWALFIGMFLLMVGNGMQGTLLGLRSTIEGFTTGEIAAIMSGYFAGFFGGSRLTPPLIRRVGHVRVFAALGSLISAALILFPVITDPEAWIALRVLIGFCFSGVYVTAESWLNDASTNETRGTTLSLYMIVQMLGVTAAQGLLAMGSPTGYVMFIIPSVLVSISFAPILLSVSPTPPFETTKPMSLRALYAASPLGCVGLFLLGGTFSAQYGMAAVYAAHAGMDVARTSLFISAFYVGALVLQFPIGYLSDRHDRRRLILLAALGAVLAALLALRAAPGSALLLISAFLMGGLTNPLYSLLIAYTNDFLEPDDMASASGGLVFINAVGAIGGPFLIGYAMELVGPGGFWLFLALLMASLALYALWRMTRRAAIPPEETGAFVRLTPATSPHIIEAAQEWAHEHTDQQDAAEGGGPDQGSPAGPGEDPQAMSGASQSRTSAPDGQPGVGKG